MKKYEIISSVVQAIAIVIHYLKVMYCSVYGATLLAIPLVTKPLGQVVRVLPDPVLCYTN